MSSAATGFNNGVVLLDLNPMAVYRKARLLVTRHPETAPLVAEIVRSYSEVFDSLTDDYHILETAES